MGDYRSDAARVTRRRSKVPERSVDLGKVDPVTFEVLRHRLWAINDEQGAIAARI